MKQFKSFALLTLALSLSSVTAQTSTALDGTAGGARSLVDTVPNYYTSDEAVLNHNFQFLAGENKVVTTTAMTEGKIFTSSTTVTFEGEAYDFETV